MRTELAEKFPSHVVCKWLGNSPDIANKHYLQVTDDHFAAATGQAPASALQNPTYSSSEMRRNASQATAKKRENPRKTEGSAPDDDSKGGWGGIRTPGTLRYDGFQDRCLRPLGHPSGIPNIVR